MCVRTESGRTWEVDFVIFATGFSPHFTKFYHSDLTESTGNSLFDVCSTAFIKRTDGVERSPELRKKFGPTSPYSRIQGKKLKSKDVYFVGPGAGGIFNTIPGTIPGTKPKQLDDQEQLSRFLPEYREDAQQVFKNNKENIVAIFALGPVTECCARQIATSTQCKSRMPPSRCQLSVEAVCIPRPVLTVLRNGETFINPETEFNCWQSASEDIEIDFPGVDIEVKSERLKLHVLLKQLELTGLLQDLLKYRLLHTFELAKLEYPPICTCFFISWVKSEDRSYFLFKCLSRVNVPIPQKNTYRLIPLDINSAKDNLILDSFLLSCLGMYMKMNSTAILRCDNITDEVTVRLFPPQTQRHTVSYASAMEGTLTSGALSSSVSPWVIANGSAQFDDNFNESVRYIRSLKLKEVPNLQSIILGNSFNQPVRCFCDLTNLKSITFGSSFQHPVDLLLPLPHLTTIIVSIDYKWISPVTYFKQEPKNLMLRKLWFTRLTRSVSFAQSDIARFQSSAIGKLQMASEEYLTQVFEAGQRITNRQFRVTLCERDLQAVMTAKIKQRVADNDFLPQDAPSTVVGNGGLEVDWKCESWRNGVRRLCYLAGVKRIAPQIYDRVGDILKVFLESVVRAVCIHRRTGTAKDVDEALSNLRPLTIYG
eukprot:Lithocolla_globosa_v1_NODE_41_length_8221_cov_7.943914.p2 type:complete len:652 gc:universal NODE_41_length_8221_cov_7.943914:6755-4800(-)